MGALKKNIRGKFLQTSTLILFSTGVIFIMLLSIPKGDSLWSRQLRVEAQINAGTWTTPTETETVTPTPTETPTPSLTPTETPLGGGGTSIEVTINAKGFKAGEVDPVFGVEGDVCVSNVGDFQTENLLIHAIVETKTEAGPFEKFTEFDIDISSHSTIGSSESFCYPFNETIDPSSNNDTKYRLNAKVTITNHSGWMPGANNCPGPELCPFGPSEKTDFDFNGLIISEQSEISSTMTFTPTLSETPTATCTETDTPTIEGTSTPTITPSATATIFESPTPPFTPSPTEEDFSPTNTSTSTLEPTPSDTPELLPTDTPVPPPTDTPVPPPTDTSVPPPTDTPEPE